MKKIAPAFLLFVFLLAYQVASAQSCSDYYPMTPGVSYELTTYDDKDRVDGIVRNTVTGARTEGSMEIATIRTIHTDKKGEETINVEYEVSCDGQNVTMDMNSVVSQQMASSMANSDADVDLEGHNPVIPNGMTVGQTLPESDLVLHISAGSMNMDFGVRVSDKHVTGMETITVPAGTFECLVIEEHQDTKLLISKQTNLKLWIAKEVGLVKQETYNKKGKLISTEVLTSFSK